MALSGSFYTNVNSGYRLQLEWTATQDEANNKSTVTAKLYWMSLSSGYVVYSSASKTASLTIDGTSDTQTTSSMANLSGGQKKLIHTFSKTITHASDGTADVTFDGWFDAEITLNGTYYSRINLTAKTYTLNTIPRESSLTSSPSFKVGEAVTFSISRASSSFTHDISVKVNGVTIQTFSGVGTSVKWTPSDADTKAMFAELAKDTTYYTQPTSIVLTTKNGSTTVGSKTYSGVASSPSASTVSSSASFTIGSTVPISITRADTGFTHTLRLYVGSSLIKTITGVSTSYDWIPSASEITAMYNATPNSTNPSTKFEVDTFFDTVLVRDTTSKTGTATVSNSNPTFTGSGITHTDTTNSAITGASTSIVQGKSNLRVTIPVASRALPVNGSTVKEYVVTVNGVEKKANWSGTADVILDMGTVSASTNQTMTIRAVDSRGLYTSVTRTVTILPYSDPVLTATARRVGGFETTTIFSASGTISPVTVSSVQKNAVTNVQYRYRKSTEADTVATWVNWSNFTVQPSGTSYTTTNVSLEFDNTVSYKVEIRVNDKFSTKVYVGTINAGKPIVFVDAEKGSIGIGKFATTTPLDVAGAGNFDGDVMVRSLEVGTSIYSSAGGGLRMNNSDIVGVNQIFRNDTATADSEADQWAKTSTPVGSTSSADYDSFRILDGTGYLNSKAIFTSDSAVLWEGAYYLQDSQSVTPSKPISKCPNGWILIWSYYSSGSAVNSNFNFTVVPKVFPTLTAGGFWASSLNTGVTDVTPSRSDKYLYVTDTKLTGSSRNNTNNEIKQVLRYVISF